jgi:hypothetical protein
LAKLDAAAGKTGKQFSIEDFYHILAIEKAKENGVNPADGTAKGGTTSDHLEMKKFLKEAFDTDDIRNIDPKELE